MPLVVVSVSPSVSVPPIVGGVFATGAGGGGGGSASAFSTFAVGFEVAVVAPPSLTAVTTMRSVSPTSAAASLCALAFAPAMSRQLPPAALQFCHWYL